MNTDCGDEGDDIEVVAPDVQDAARRLRNLAEGCRKEWGLGEFFANDRGGVVRLQTPFFEIGRVFWDERYPFPLRWRWQVVVGWASAPPMRFEPQGGAQSPVLALDRLRFALVQAGCREWVRCSQCGSTVPEACLRHVSPLPLERSHGFDVCLRVIGHPADCAPVCEDCLGVLVAAFEGDMPLEGLNRWGLDAAGKSPCGR